MGKGQRNKANRSHSEIIKHRKDLARRVELINKKTGLKWHEALMIKVWYYWHRLKIQHISRVVYDTYLTNEKKWFKKIAYMNYAEGKLWKDFSDFHGIMITRCAINDNEWTNYLTYDGNIKRGE
jgi:hypothetical protein